MRILKYLRNNKSAILSIFLLFIASCLITLFFYNGIERVYFQQDEWFKTGKSIYYVYSDFASLWNKRFGFHYYPFLNLFFIAQYLVFKMNVVFYMYTGVVLQGFVAVVLYIFFKKLFSAKIFAAFLTFLFLINPGNYQVILNEMVSTSYKIPVIIMLSIFILLYNSIQKKGIFSQKILIALSFLYIISVLFFEGSLIMVVLIPLFYLLFKNKGMIFEFNKTNFLILVFLAALTITRLVLQNMLPVDAPLPIEGNFIVSTMYNAITTPFKFLAEFFLNTQNIFKLGEIYDQRIFPLRNSLNIDHGLISVTVGYELVVAYFTACFAIVSFGIIAWSKKSGLSNKYLKIIIFAIFWILVNAAVIAPQGRIFNNLEPRYLYISGIGLLMISGSLVGILWEALEKRSMFRLLLILLLAVYTLWWSIFSYNSINITKTTLIKLSEVRSSFIKQFMSYYLTLPDNTIIYIYCSDDCSSNATLGLPPEWVVPFQNGLGWVLLIMYSDDNPRKYSPYFSNYLFWDNKSKGYRKIGNTSFGFFTDLKELRKTMRENSLIPSDITVLKYESKKFKLTPVSNKKKVLFPDAAGDSM